MVNADGSFILGVPDVSFLSVRPSIYLKPTVEVTGEGTELSPFKVVGDKETGKVNDKISTRSVGEYISFNDELYRIVEKDNNTTKIVMAGYLKVSNEIITKSFASTPYFGKTGNTESDEYFDYYLNNTWYNSLSSANKNLLVSNTYYLAPMRGTNYKATICSDNDLRGLTTKTCTKYTDANNTFTGKVGMLRLGEIFASQIEIGNSPSILWLITRDSTNSYLRVIQPGGYVQKDAPTITAAVKPTITLKDTVKILSGSGTIQDPYVVGL